MPRALDLFCGGGGCSHGLAEAGFEVVGVDSDPKVVKSYTKHPNCEIIISDVMSLDPKWIAEFDFVWASPPCQRFSSMTKRHGTQENHPDLIGPVRDLLEDVGIPYAMENVQGAPLREDALLCGRMFGLDLLYRHRVIEASFPLEQLTHPPHGGRYITVTGNTGGVSKRDGSVGRGTAAEWREAMGIDWMPASRLKEAIPPAYSRWVGHQFLSQH